MSLTEQGYDPPPGALLDWLLAIDNVVKVQVPGELRRRHGGGADDLWSGEPVSGVAPRALNGAGGGGS